MRKNEHPDKAYKNLEFLNSDEARTIRILSEYIEPLARLTEHKVNSTVLFLGSSKAKPDETGSIMSKFYWETEEIAFRLAKWAIKLKPKGKNFVVCTGGGPGLMEAANRGAARAGGKSIGMNISIPEEQSPNAYISSELSFIFHYFFMRKFWLVNLAKAIVALPGGFGTLDELFEILTLIQTGKIHKDQLYILLYGKEYWDEIIDFEGLLKHKAIDAGDAHLFATCSSPEEAVSFLTKNLLHFL
ncbi:MAG: TIGR00730 family Rossman fold protein [Candidatus Aminicenantes bacterium]|nr:MAG: TIGR00730 family Rossman fold protein [Candidatus Aminicenantes bacterium]